MKIRDLLAVESIDLNGKVTGKNETLDAMVALMAKSGKINDVEKYRKGVYAREEEGTTGIGEGIAIPHCKSDAVSRPGLAAMVIKDGVDFDALDGEKVSLIFLIALFVITGIAAPGFLTYDNIVTCFNTATMYTLLAVGIAFVIMTGEIDVSIGATLGLTAGMTGLIAQQDGSILKMLLLCLATGAAIGLVNGVGVSYFGVPSLIFTLGTNSVVRGLIYIMSGGRTIENFGGAISSYGNKTVFAGVTLYYAIAVVLVAISHLALTKTRKGKYFIAVGDNAGGANLVGISVLGTKILAYVLCGLFAGLGGFVFASKYGQVMTVAGNGYEMTAIAACVLGGISLSGGLGNVVGAAIGAVIMSSIGRLLVFIGLPSTYNNTITGTMLIVIVVIDALAQRRSIEMTRRKRLLSRTADQEGGAKA